MRRQDLRPRPARILLLLLPVAAALLAALPGALAAGDAALTAEEIVRRSSDRRSVENSVQTLTMTLFDKSGRAREPRTLESKVKRGADGRTKSYVRFVQPADVAGVQFLTIENTRGEDDQYIYMPAIGSENRISGSSKKSAFMGSDFSYEDLSVGQADDGTHTLLPEAAVTVGGAAVACYVVESVPKPELGSAYAKIVSSIDKADLMPRLVDFWNARGEHVKRMTILEVKKDGNTVIPVRTVMENLKTGTKTEVTVGSYKVNVAAAELPDALFTVEYMKGE